MFWSKKGKKILLIEDDADISETYKMRLGANNFIVETASDGEKGMEKIRSSRPDLVLLDIVMPKKDGFDFLEALRNEPKEIKKIPIIVLSNLASPIDIEQGKRFGVKEWWVKSFNTPSQIAQKVIEFFEANK